MEVVVNVWGVVGAAVAAMMIGSVWYSPVMFYKQWSQLAKVPQMKGKQAQQAAMKAMMIAAVLSLLTAYIVAHVTYLSYTFFGTSFLSAGVQTGFWLWLGIAMPMCVMSGVFEGRRKKLMLINVGSQLVTLVAMGAIIGAVGV